MQRARIRVQESGVHWLYWVHRLCPCGMVANTSHTEERLPRKGRVRTAVCKFPYVYRVLVFFFICASVRACRFPTVGFQLACNHRRQILHTTSSHYGSANDKTITRHDAVVIAIHEGRTLTDFKFELFDADGNKTGHTGPYFLCDGGYHKWRCLMDPIKHTSNSNEARYSKWLEAMRKDGMPCPPPRFLAFVGTSLRIKTVCFDTSIAQWNARLEF